VPGIPQVYYVGLLAGTNDMELLARSNVGRDINRHNYTPSEVENSLKSPVVQKLGEPRSLGEAGCGFQQNPRSGHLLQNGR
jgi:hypothetical protein